MSAPRFTPPSSVPDPGSPLYAPWLLRQLRELADDQAAARDTDGSATITQERLEVPAGTQHRVSPATAGMAAILEAPGPGNFGKTAVLIIEAPLGALRVVASPHVAADGKVTASLINDAAQATFTLPGVVSFTSNGVDGWKTPAQTPTETPAIGAAADSEAALDAEYVLGATNAVLPNARVATTSTEISVDRSVGGLVSWALRTASVAFSKLANLAGLSVLGRAGNSSGVMAAITATAGSQRLESNAAGTALAWVSALSVQFDDSITGTQDPYLLPVGFKSGDSLVFVITGDVTFNRLRLSDDSVPPDGFEVKLSLRDQSGGSAPGWFFDIVDTGAVTSNGSFRTPGQVQGTSPGPSYRMQSEEEACILIIRAGNWRLHGGTAAQAVTGDVVIPAGNGSTRTAAIGTGVIVDADVNASAAIAQTKLGATTGFSVKASGASATTSAEPIVTYSATANMSAERVTTSTTSITVDIVTAGQIQFKRAAITGDVLLSADSNAATIAAGVVTPAKLAAVASNIAVPFLIRVAFAAGGTPATPDDVTVFSANAPFAFRIVEVRLIVSTAVALSTAQLRDTSGGGGAALSSSYVTAVAGEAAINASWTATTTVAANGSVFLRRSDQTIAGEVLIYAVPT